MLYHCIRPNHLKSSSIINNMKQYSSELFTNGVRFFAKWEHHFATSGRIKIIEIAIVGSYHHDITAIIEDDRIVHDQFESVLRVQTEKINQAATTTA